MMHTVSQYLGSQLETNPLSSELLHSGSSPVSVAFWDNILTGIYLIKITPSLSLSHRNGFAAIGKACDLASDALSATPLDFLPRLLHTLSPTNVPCPSLRTQLLRLVGGMAMTRYENADHPIAVTCRWLLQDTHEAEVSKQALVMIRDVVGDSLGRSHPAAFDLEETIVEQTRRSGDPNGAARMAKGLLEPTARAFGAGSIQMRTLHSELAHCLMAGGEYQKALTSCLEIVNQPDGSLHDDDAASYAMEDIAEIYGRFNLVGEAMLWLERAAKIAVRVRGEKEFSTIHVFDKLEAHKNLASGQRSTDAKLGWGGCKGMPIDVPAFSYIDCRPDLAFL